MDGIEWAHRLARLFLDPIGTMDPEQLHHWAILEEYHFNTWKKNISEGDLRIIMQGKLAYLFLTQRISFDKTMACAY
ncbi:hypothetical protein D3C85_1441810 [compost metagenome]